MQQPKAEAIKNGVEIDRTYTDKDGKPVTSVKLGDVVNVQVKVTISAKCTAGYGDYRFISGRF